MSIANLNKQPAVEIIKLAPQSLITQIYNKLKKSLINGDLKPGEKLKIDTLKDKLSLRGGVNVSLYNVSGNIDGRVLTNEAIVWNGNLSSTVTLPANFKFEVNGFYSSPRASLQGTRASYQRISFAIQKDIWKKKGSIGIVAVQPFSRDLRFINELEGTNFYQRSENAFAQRSYGINFSYRFGKLDFKAPKERAKRINNRDLKDDGGDNSF